MDDDKSERTKRIGKRANALMRAGFYDRLDVEGVREMVHNGIPLSQIEWLIYDAEQQAGIRANGPLRGESS